MKNYGKWACEGQFDKARFLRQKTYIEQFGEEIKITCAGMGKQCYNHVTFDNFKIGLTVPRKFNFKACKRWGKIN